MDIVESLRKYQCPENKGCNPVVEYCQCALMDSGADEIKRLQEALKDIDGQMRQADRFFLKESTLLALRQKETT